MPLSVSSRVVYDDAKWIDPLSELYSGFKKHFEACETHLSIEILRKYILFILKDQGKP